MKMNTRLLALLAFVLAISIVSSGCVNRYEGCIQDHIYPNFASGASDPDYTCCIQPGGVYPDPIHRNRARVCCSGTEPMQLAGETGQRCHYTFTSYLSSWESIALLAVIISALLTALAYMVAHLLSNQMLLIWAKNEFFQVMASAFIVGSFIGFVFFLQGAIVSQIGNPAICDPSARSPSGIPDCHILLAHSYLGYVYSDTVIMSRDIVEINSALHTIRMVTFVGEEFVASYFGMPIRPFAGLGVPVESLKTAFDILVKVMLLLKLQQILLNYIELALFPILFVMGIVLRTFFFTRKLGGLLIALAIGLYLVYPMVYVIAHNIWFMTIRKDRAGDPQTETIGSSIIKSHLDRRTEYDLQLKLFNPDPSLTNEQRLAQFRETSGGISEDIGEVVINQGYVIGNGGVLEKTGILLVYATFVPFIALMTTIGFVRGLSVLLGGDIEIAGLTHLI